MKLKSAHQILPALTTQHTPALTTCSDKWLHTHINTGKKKSHSQKKPLWLQAISRRDFLKIFFFFKRKNSSLS